MEGKLKQCQESINGLEEKFNEMFDDFENKLMDKLLSMLAQIIPRENK